MEGRLLKEIDYLTRLIEQHKKKSDALHSCKSISNISRDIYLEKTDCTKSSLQMSQTQYNPDHESNKYSCTKTQFTTTNVYVNPNFKPLMPAIHINPKICSKPLIHINPKMMKDVASTNENINNNTTAVAQRIESNIVPLDIKRSVYVNPKLMNKLSSVTESKVTDKKVITHTNNRSSCSRLKLTKNASSLNVVTKKNTNSNMVVLSRRKLVRLRRSSKGSLSFSPISISKVKKISNSPFKKLKSLPLTTTANNAMLQRLDIVSSSTNKDNLSLKLNNTKLKINKYRIDRTIPQVAKSRENSDSKKITNTSTGLITIGGIVYKSSRNQLVRRSYSLKKKRTANIKSDKFIIATNGKKLRRFKINKDTSNPSHEVINKQYKYTNNVRNSTNREQKFGNSIVQKTNYKTNISNKAKQRSIQILRNKMRKNNQPCLLFQKFGYCANQKKGTCSKLHDKKQVSVCKMFLQGKCFLEECPLSHDVGPEKMPTCKYFLEGCCTRDACPYLHVKVSSNTPICIEFLKGYCAKGNECKRRHEYMCPEFNKEGKCNKGKYCPYPHKSHLSTVKQTDKHLQRKPEVSKSQIFTVDDSNVSSNNENRPRYYESSLSENIDKKRENIMKKIKIMKNVENAVNSCCSVTEMVIETEKANILDTEEPESEVEIISETKLSKRRPIGFLPAYIPIN